MKINLIVCLTLVSAIFLMSFTDSKKANTAEVKTTVTSKTFNKSFNFMIVSDFGWNGEKHQQEVADQMAKTANSINVKFTATCGENFQMSEIASTQDPIWAANFENIYKSNALQVEWFPVLGNHDYKGNTQAEIDYSMISHRWRMTDQIFYI